jgi:peptide-methionine (S)-S-oxide reductase
MRRQRAILVTAAAMAVGYVWLSGGFVGLGGGRAVEEPSSEAGDSRSGGLFPPEGGVTAEFHAASAELQKATFAAGCFWCVEADFDKVPGVVSTTSGYTGGRVPSPTYQQVSRGDTGHTEAVEIVFDPSVVRYEQLLEHYWRNVDPFVAHRQFCDVGDQYRPEIFVHDGLQREAAERSKQEMQRRFSEPILVRITDAETFYRAESYHQDYYRTHSVPYRYYRWRCGRDARLAQIWEQP